MLFKQCSFNEGTQIELLRNEKSKRKRKMKKDINLNYKCTVENCGREYGYDQKIRKFIKSAH